MKHVACTMSRLKLSKISIVVCTSLLFHSLLWLFPASFPTPAKAADGCSVTVSRGSDGTITVVWTGPVLTGMRPFVWLSNDSAGDEIDLSQSNESEEGGQLTVWYEVSADEFEGNNPDDYMVNGDYNSPGDNCMAGEFGTIGSLSSTGELPAEPPVSDPTDPLTKPTCHPTSQAELQQQFAMRAVVMLSVFAM